MTVKVLPEENTDPPLKYAFLDPGEMTGWAVFDESGRLLFFGQVELRHELTALLRSFPDTITQIVYEDYIIRPGVNHSGSRGPAMVAIGKIQAYAELFGIRIDKQQPSIKSIGYTRLKMKPPSNHAISHQFDAVAHGEYWVWRNKVRKVWAAKQNDTGSQDSTKGKGTQDSVMEEDL